MMSLSHIFPQIEGGGTSFVNYSYILFVQEAAVGAPAPCPSVRINFSAQPLPNDVAPPREDESVVGRIEGTTLLARADAFGVWRYGHRGAEVRLGLEGFGS